MSVPVLTFFNNKGGVGKTSLVYHLAWMLSDMGLRVVAIDLDPQANLTSAFLPDEELEALWDGSEMEGRNKTVYQCLEPLTETSDITSVSPKKINNNLYLIPGDLDLSRFEDFLSQEWPNALDSNRAFRSFRVLTALWRLAQGCAKDVSADVILADVGPNLGAINRSALIGTDYVVIPLAADLFSLQGLKNLGPTLRVWRADWRMRVDHWAKPRFELPQGTVKALGYIVMQHMERNFRPVKSYERWVAKIPETYRKSVLGEPSSAPFEGQDPYCLARLKHYRSLAPMALEARKPIFHLTNADGAIGSHGAAVRDARDDFRRLARVILEKMGLELPVASKPPIGGSSFIEQLRKYRSLSPRT
jgi:chromosome partitioning protein